MPVSTLSPGDIDLLAKFLPWAPEDTALGKEPVLIRARSQSDVTSAIEWRAQLHASPQAPGNIAQSWHDLPKSRQFLPGVTQCQARSSAVALVTRQTNLQMALLSDVLDALKTGMFTNEPTAMFTSADKGLLDVVKETAESYVTVNSENARAFCKNLRIRLRTLEREWRVAGLGNSEPQQIEKNLSDKLSFGQEVLRSWVNSVFKDARYERDIAGQPPVESASSRKLSNTVPSATQHLASTGNGKETSAESENSVEILPTSKKSVDSGFNRSEHGSLPENPSWPPSIPAKLAERARAHVATTCIEEIPHLIDEGIECNESVEHNSNYMENLRKPNISNAYVKKVLMEALPEIITIQTRGYTSFVLDELTKRSVSLENFLKFIGEEKNHEEVRDKVRAYVYVLQNSRIVSTEPGDFTRNLCEVLVKVAGLKTYGYTNSKDLKFNVAAQSGIVSYRKKLQPLIDQAEKFIANDAWKIQDIRKTSESAVVIGNGAVEAVEAVENSNSLSALELRKPGKKRDLRQELIDQPVSSKRLRMEPETPLRAPNLSSDEIAEIAVNALPHHTLAKTKKTVEYVLGELARKSFSLRNFLEFVGESGQKDEAVRNKIRAYIVALRDSLKLSNEKPEIIYHKDLLWVLGKLVSLKMYSMTNNENLRFRGVDSTNIMPTKKMQVFLDSARKAIQNGGWEGQKISQTNPEDSVISANIGMQAVGNSAAPGYSTELLSGHEEYAAPNPTAPAIVEQIPVNVSHPGDPDFLMNLFEMSGTAPNTFSWNAGFGLENAPALSAQDVAAPYNVEQSLAQLSALATSIAQPSSTLAQAPPESPESSDESWMRFFADPDEDFNIHI